jgi:hypothetical protein
MLTSLNIETAQGFQNDEVLLRPSDYGGAGREKFCGEPHLMFQVNCPQTKRDLPMLNSF